MVEEIAFEDVKEHNVLVYSTPLGQPTSKIKQSRKIAENQEIDNHVDTEKSIR